MAINSLMAMVGGVLSALLIGRNDPGFAHNGALAGLVAICAGSDVMHPVGALATGGIAGALFVWAFNVQQNRLRIDDVLGVWPLHGLCGALGGMGGVSFMAQLVGTITGVVIAAAAGIVVYGVLKKTSGIRLSEEQEFIGVDLALHKISATPEEDLSR